MSTVREKAGKLLCQPCLGGRIIRCTSSVRLSVCPVPSIHSKLESRKNFKFGGDGYLALHPFVIKKA